MTVTLPALYSGKVRDIYDAGDGRLLMVASDRLSAFDVVMTEPVPDKGRVLTAMSVFWFEHFADLAPSHLISADVADFPAGAQGPEVVGRSMLCRRADMLPIECIVRGYLSGSAWKEYRTKGTMHGVALPAGLQESDRLPEPVRLVAPHLRIRGQVRAGEYERESARARAGERDSPQVPAGYQREAHAPHPAHPYPVADQDQVAQAGTAARRVQQAHVPGERGTAGTPA